MLQNMTFHVRFTCRSLNLILPARDLIYVDPSLVRDALRPIAPTQSRALTLVPSSLYLRGLYYTVQRANNFPLTFKICYATFGIKLLSLY